MHGISACAYVAQDTVDQGSPYRDEYFQYISNGPDPIVWVQNAEPLSLARPYCCPNRATRAPSIDGCVSLLHLAKTEACSDIIKSAGEKELYRRFSGASYLKRESDKLSPFHLFRLCYIH